MRLILIDRNKDVCDVLRWEFRSHPEAEIVHGRMEDLRYYDCIITAGNSFGLMDAGTDLAMVREFGLPLMHSIQRTILEDYLGEQPVGTCILVPTGSAKRRFVAHAPTMRIPMNIAGTDHVYLAFWAALTAVHRQNKSLEVPIECIACPGLGMGTGGMNPQEAALQLRLAFEHFKNPPQFINPSVAQARHERVYYGGKWGFEHPRGQSV